jgi:hypothetical protein
VSSNKFSTFDLLKKLVYFQKHVILLSELKQKNNNIVFINKRQDKTLNLKAFLKTRNLSKLALMSSPLTDMTQFSRPLT